jgi:hypothetical protein
MSSGLHIERLMDPNAWRPSPIAADVLVSEIGLAEAAQLAGPGEARDAIEAFLEAHRVVSPGLRGLVIFVMDESGGISGFVEVHPGPAGGFAWHGPNGPMGPLFLRP